jgi:coproporphyrinogen III oxidase
MRRLVAARGCVKLPRRSISGLASQQQVSVRSRRVTAAALAAAAALCGTVAYSHISSSSATCAAITSIDAVSSSPPRPAAGISETRTTVSSFIGDVVPLPPSAQTAAISLQQLALLFTPNPSASSPPPLSYPSYSYSSSPPLIFSASASPLHQQLEAALRQTQDIICQHILNIEGGAAAASSSGSSSSPSPPPASFRQDLTVRPDGGGIARVLQSGRVFQKAGVNSSFAAMRLPFGKLKDMADDHAEIAEVVSRNDWSRRQRALRGDEGGVVYGDSEEMMRFTASLSLVIHSVNPFVPTCHMNYRYFHFTLPDGKSLSWFAGGTDLTPAYVRDDDCRFFHSTLKAVCDRYDAAYYPSWKRWCDRYFYIRHRQETRGVGGIFFDDLTATPATSARYLQLIRDLSSSFSASYFPLVLRHHASPYTLQQHQWQQLRRGRYVEFNLMYDKGTSFGLQQPNARPEAILMSMPLTARYEYKPEVKPSSDEEYTLKVLRQPKDWV